MPRSAEEVIERKVQLTCQQIIDDKAIPSDVHFMLIAYRADGKELYMTWAGTGTLDDRKRVIAELHHVLLTKR